MMGWAKKKEETPKVRKDFIRTGIYLSSESKKRVGLKLDWSLWKKKFRERREKRGGASIYTAKSKSGHST